MQSVPDDNVMKRLLEKV